MQIVEHIDKRFANEAQVIAYYRRQLESGDIKVLDDLGRTRNIWDGSFVQPLVRMFESKPGNRDVLPILMNRGWPQKDSQIARRLSKALLAANPILSRKPNELTDEQLRRWSWLVRSLGRTGDREAIALVRPYLDVRTPIREQRATAVPSWLGPWPALRACDCALEAIVTILDGDAAKFYPSEGVKWTVRDHRQHDKNMVEVYDDMIRSLQERLTRLDATVERDD